MKRKGLTLVAMSSLTLALVPTIVVAQKVKYATTRTSTDCSSDTIWKNVQRLTKILRNREAIASKWTLTLSKVPPAQRHWMAHGEGLSFYFLASNGGVFQFFDYGTRDAVLKGTKSQSGPKRYDTAHKAAVAMAEMAGELGFPADLRVVNPKTVLQSSTPEKVFAAYGCAFANRQGRQQATMVIDAYTGLVTEYWIADSRVK